MYVYVQFKRFREECGVLEYEKEVGGNQLLEIQKQFQFVNR